MDLPDYAGEPLTVRLDDTDSAPIVETRLSDVPSKGNSGSKWQYKLKANGVQKVQLTRKAPGSFQIGIKAKRWFATADANDPANLTAVTVTVGTQCFTHGATKKID